jgi:hypothetical protein
MQNLVPFPIVGIYASAHRNTIKVCTVALALRTLRYLDSCRFTIVVEIEHLKLSSSLPHSQDVVRKIHE